MAIRHHADRRRRARGPPRRPRLRRPRLPLRPRPPALGPRILGRGPRARRAVRRPRSGPRRPRPVRRPGGIRCPRQAISPRARACGASTTVSRWSPTTRATACTPRAPGGCSAGSATGAVAVLDGGFAAWVAAGQPVAPRRPAREPRRFIARPDAGAIVDAAFLARHVVAAPPGAPRVRLVDARAADRFAGQNETIDPVAGHVPGALESSVRPQSRRRRPLSAAGGAARALGDRRCSPTRLPRWSRCAARASPPATTCWRSSTRACRAPACMPARGASGSAIPRAPSPPAPPERARQLIHPPPSVKVPRMSADPTAVNGNDAHSSASNGASGARRNGAPPWSVDDSLDLYHVKAWGKGYFSVNDAGHVVVRPGPAARARDRPVRGRAGTEGARSDDAGGRALLRHPRPPPAAPARRVRAGDRRERIPQPLCGGVPDQGEPAATGRRGGVPLRQGVRLRPRGGQQARTAGRDGDERGFVRPPDRLQRLQGRQLHRGGDPRHQARPHDHSRGRELLRARPDPQAREEVRRAAAHRRARQARERRLGQAGATRPARSRSSACSSPRSSSWSRC